MTHELTDQPTEEEIALLMASLAEFPEHKMVARRMAFEIDRLREGIRYWSHCTGEGMQKTCPELRERFIEFMTSCKVHPWYGG